MEFEKMLFDRRGEVTTITLNRPERHNALDKELSAELNQAVRDVRADRECRVLVLRGAGNTFCAGDDIRDFATWTSEDPYWQVELYQETVNLIEDLTPVTIAAVDGACTGGGLELTLRRTKFALNKSADMTVHQALSLERPIVPFPMEGAGIRDFQTKEGREKRRRLSRDFWSG